jgi:hypothetical protein
MFKELFRATIKGADQMEMKELREKIHPHCDLFDDLTDEEIEAEIKGNFLQINGDEVVMMIEEF